MKISILPLVAALCWLNPHVVTSISLRHSSTEIQYRTDSIGSAIKSPLDVRGGAGKPVSLEKKELPPGKYSLGRVLEFHKAMWLPVSLALNYYFNNFSARSCLMAGLFGGYGINWVIKSHTFWDKGFYNDDMSVVGLAGAIFFAMNISLFFLFPYVAAKNLDPIHPIEVMVSSLLYSIGTIFHYGSDAQKFYTLKYKGSGLITEGFFSKFSSPAHVGEKMIFAAFAIVAGIRTNPLVWVPFGFTFLALAVNASKKTRSLGRHQEYDDWKKQTWL